MQPCQISFDLRSMQPGQISCYLKSMQPGQIDQFNQVKFLVI